MLDVGRPHHGSRDHPFAKTGREAFDLLLDPRQHVEGRTVRNVTVRPDDVLALRRARSIEQCRLREEHERRCAELTAQLGRDVEQAFELGEGGIVPVARSHAELMAGGLAVLLESGIGPHAVIQSTLAPSSFAGICLSLVPWLL